MMIELELPYPVATNRYWRTFRNRMVVSKEATIFKKQVAMICAQAGCKPTDEFVDVHLKIRPRLTKKGDASKVVVDLDATKVIFDALQGWVFVDDNQVKRILAEYGEPVEGGGTYVRVMKFEKKGL